MSQIKKCISIAIIGGGASGVSTFIQLIEELSSKKSDDGPQIKIYLVEKEKRLGPGLAYQVQSDSNILNMRANLMGVTAKCPNGFMQWLKQQPIIEEGQINEDSYLPRAYMGEYLEQALFCYIKKAIESRISVSLIRDQAENVSPINGKFSVDLKCSGDLEVDYLVLSIGHWITNPFKKISSMESYLHNPWDKIRLGGIKKNAAVCIIGTRLTAIDAVINLVESGHIGQIYMASRHGWLPSVQGLPGNCQKDLTKRLEKYLSRNKKISLKQIVLLVKKEIESSYQKKLSLDDLVNRISDCPKRWLNSEIQKSQKHRMWQSILNAVSPYANLIWRRLHMAEKKIFMKRFYSLWMSYRHSIPVNNAVKISNYLKTGQLHVHGGLRHVQFNEEDQLYQVFLKFPHALKANYLINGTGPGRNLGDTTNPFLMNLLKSGFLMPCPLGGAEINPETLSPISQKGRQEDKCFLLGSITNGHYFYVNALEQNAKQALLISEQISLAINRKQECAVEI